MKVLKILKNANSTNRLKTTRKNGFLQIQFIASLYYISTLSTYAFEYNLARFLREISVCAFQDAKSCYFFVEYKRIRLTIYLSCMTISYFIFQHLPSARRAEGQRLSL